MKFIEKYKLELSVVLGLFITVTLGEFTNFNQQCSVIREETFRLHIKANSDNEADQNLKLEVRDEILNETEEMFLNANAKEMAKEISKEQINDIEKIAEEKVKEKGFDYSVSAKVDKMYFSTRYYDTFTLPAGYYDALSVDIGSGSGQNWWCVLFPPLCLPAVTEEENQENLDEIYSESQQDIITNDEYEVKFAVVEMFENFKHSVGEMFGN